MTHSSDDLMTIAPRERVRKLREWLKTQTLGAFVVPTQDRFQSEYPPDAAKRLAYLCGFTGSAGTLLVLATPVDGKEAMLFTDGRYTLQAADQLDSSRIGVVDSGVQSAVDWLAQHAPGAALGFDPWLHTAQQVRGWKRAQPSLALKAVAENPVDAIWPQRPAEPAEPISEHPLAYAGESSAAKREKLCAQMKQDGVDALFIGLADSVNWLLNLRGQDVAFNPLVLAYALLEPTGKVRLICHPRNVAKEFLINVEWLELESFCRDPAACFSGYQRVQLDPSSVGEAIMQAAQAAGCELVEAADPTLLAKAIKNATEIEGTRNAHARDGRALCAFIRWAKAQASLSELQVVETLAALRAEHGEGRYRGDSFDTIAGTGAHGAIVHYRATPASNRHWDEGELLLVDSGGQYLDGTTDVTRTLIRGTPSAEMVDRYTRVLKGHIALARVVFPLGTTGAQLDALARQPLWEIGLDYDHGTGHGVGSFLCVHEGPQRIGKRGGDVPLQPGMILSNEPGYYKAGEYGIRIENLVLVVPYAGEGADRDYLCFETLTLAPMETALIDFSQLSEAENAWLEAYHARVEGNV